MTHKENAHAILHYQPYDQLPIVYFGFLAETLQKWYMEGHITEEEADGWPWFGSPIDESIGRKLGFDFDWFNCYMPNKAPLQEIDPSFERKIIKVHPDGSREVINCDGVTVIEKDDATSIPCEVGHILTDRKSWEKHYLPRLQFSEDRLLCSKVNTGSETLPFTKGGLDYLKREDREKPLGLYCGSVIGRIRCWLGLVGSSYLMYDDEALYKEMVKTVADLNYKCVKYILEKGAKFDYAHFWEDICFKNGPLVSPPFFEEKAGPYYKRMTELAGSYDIDIVSLDCDGMIDSLIPTWFYNGVNTMFPIEVGTWHASIKSWREKFGKDMRGVGGVDKKVFARDTSAVDSEIERLKPLVELGGYIPCPDHLIPPDAKWENVQYYCDRMRATFNR